MASAGKGTGAALLLAAVASLPLSAAAAKADFGKQEYEANCAVCHGVSGKGDGPYAGLGDQTVANLTTLAKRNGGMFPFQRVYETIDGTVAVKAHGTADMPIWGQRYRAEAGQTMFDVPYDPEVYIRTRILALTEYVSRLQAK